MRKTTALLLILTWFCGNAAAGALEDLRRYSWPGQVPAAEPAGPFQEEQSFNHNESQRCVRSGDPFAVPAYLFATPDQAQHPDRPQTITVIGGTGTSYPVHEGQCVSQEKYRPALRLTDGQRAEYGLAGTADPVYANIRHLGRFYAAVIPADAVKELYFQLAYFRIPLIGPRPGHAQVRALFSRPVLLLPQFPKGSGETLRADSLIFTANAVATETDSFETPIRYVDGSALLALGAVTDESSLADQFVLMPGVEIRQYRLRLAPEKRGAYVREYLRQASTRRLSTHYRFLSVNCNTSQLGVLDRVLRGDYSAGQLADMAARNDYDPAAAVAALEARGLTSEAERAINFEQEPAAAAFRAGYRP